MKNNKTTKIDIRLEPRERKLLNYFATRLGVSPSALVRNQIKVLLSELEGKVEDNFYANLAKVSITTGPIYTHEEIKQLFEVK
jgi:predicted DNA-binding protein